MSGTAVFTVLALLAFATNSLLCRLALAHQSIDAASFTTIRIASGAVTLYAVVHLTSGTWSSAARIHWRSAIALFLYAIAFSLAYLSLPAGTGALILFGAVQTTMLATALWSGERPRMREWIGLATAVGGLVYLIAPGLAAPSFAGSLLMAIAGISWGLYSLWGRRATDPLADTTINFVRALPFSVVFSLASLSQVHLSVRGSLIATVSGALASGLGYIAWYAALPGLTTTRAATVQLAVPVIAGAGGVVFLAEAITNRLLVSAALVLGGIGLTVLSRRRP